MTPKAARKLSPSAIVGAAMLGVFVLAGVLGPWLAPYDMSINTADLTAKFAGASSAHLLGADANGRDTLSQLLWGARSALELSVYVVAISSTLGLAVGTTAGWYRGPIDEALMRVVDILMSFPGILLNIAVVAVVRDPGLGVMIAALAVNGWVGYARVARGQVLALRERDYVLAARSLGASNRRIMTRHLLPNIMGPALVQMSFGFGGVILVEAALSFIGVGPQLDYTWGAMLKQAGEQLWKTDWAPFYALGPGLAIMWVVLGANLLGDGLRDRLDPRQRGRS